jgi:hypothetical protein
MLQAFAWAWVFSDGMFFVGMLTPQSSITNESVVRVFFSITAARMFQLAGAYLIDKAFIGNTADGTDYPDRTGAIIAAILVQFASLVGVIATFTEFLSTIEFSRVASLSSSEGPSYYAIQILFLIFVGIMPELLRSVNIFSATYSTNSKADPDSFLTLAEIIFTWEWVSRLVFAYITILPLGDLVRNQEETLISFLTSTA